MALEVAVKKPAKQWGVVAEATPQKVKTLQEIQKEEQVATTTPTTSTISSSSSKIASSSSGNSRSIRVEKNRQFSGEKMAEFHTPRKGGEKEVPLDMFLKKVKKNIHR